ncbi:TetR/AcrR family transcriptional regulator [Aurantiacibacter odishensis]|uniref:TetR/AcrR family transcriptional regulator n=1 Tax=Aurantiacibacter odishensis TaxID=1155476 RepID=UPI001F0BE9CF|nr:TetR/AcrR family transcriptional regulator [Aurantiacibacter odishensis]
MNNSRISSADESSRPLIEPTAQALKSARTRSRLIEATIRCLVKYSYANTTTPKVAEEAGLSRGAMLHHFDNGRQLMQATMVELHHKRLRAFRRAAGTLDHDARTLLRTYWEQLLRSTFIAFQELAIASRTDKELAKTLEPVRKEFNERWHDLAIELFPEWSHDPTAFKVALGLTHNTLEGMALNRLTHGIDDETIELVLDKLEQVILELRPDRKS